MKKRIIAIVTALLCVALLFVGCGKPAEPDVPEFSNDKEIVIGVWSGSMTKYDTQQFSNLEMADINLLVATSESFIQYNTTFFDMAQAAGVKVLPDSRKWNGQAPSFLEHPAFAGCSYFLLPYKTDLKSFTVSVLSGASSHHFHRGRNNHAAAYTPDKAPHTPRR